MILTGILAAAALLRAYDLTKYGFWYDEAFTVLDKWGLNKIAPVDKLFAHDFLTRNFDYLRMAYSRIMLFWGGLFGNSEYAARAFSVLAGLACVVLLYILAKTMFGRRAAWISAALLAISPMHIHYSQEATVYTLVCAFSLLSVYFFVKALGTGAKRYWAMYAISSALCAYLLYMAFLLQGALFIFFAFNIKRYRHLLKSFAVSYSAMIFLIAPVLLNLYPNIRFIMKAGIDPAFSEFPIWAGNKVSLSQIVFTVKNFSIGYNTDCALFAGRMAAFVFSVLLMWGAWAFRRDWQMRLLLTCVVLPVTALFAISFIKPCYVDRYFFPELPLYLLVIGAGLSAISHRTLLAVTCSFILYLDFFGLQNYYLNRFPRDLRQFIGVEEKYDARQAARYIFENYRQGDIIAHASKNTVFPLKLYARQYNASAEAVSEADKGTVIFASAAAKRGLFAVDYDLLHPVSFEPGQYKEPGEGFIGAPRVWFIFSDFVFPKQDGASRHVIDILRNERPQVVKKRFEGVVVYLFGSANQISPTR